jgi:hypothetical protein
MFKVVAKSEIVFPIWFLAESRVESPNAVGVREATGFLTLPLFTDENLAKRFVEIDRSKNVVIARIDDQSAFVALLKKSVESFTSAVFNPPRIGSRLPIEYLLKGIEEKR